MKDASGIRKTISIVIPSYRRGQVALDTIDALLELRVGALEILLVDQTSEHPAEVRCRLESLSAEGLIRWIVLAQPSIPHAMNCGLLAAQAEAVLFLDDDIVPDGELVAAHGSAQTAARLVAGQVLQPGQTAHALAPCEGFRFNSTSAADIGEFMGGNFSIDRTAALELGGFDENFIGAAYRFEAEFADRWVRSYGPIRFEPAASIRHLAIATGGTRAHGHHLRTASPAHASGAYYFLLRTRHPGWWRKMLWRPLRAVRTRHHLRRPWWIPVTLIAEVRGLLLALRLSRRGPNLPFRREC